jgi:hypothetical protein
MVHEKTMITQVRISPNQGAAPATPFSLFYPITGL